MSDSYEICQYCKTFIKIYFNWNSVKNRIDFSMERKKLQISGKL